MTEADRLHSERRPLIPPVVTSPGMVATRSSADAVPLPPVPAAVGSASSVATAIARETPRSSSPRVNAPRPAETASRRSHTGRPTARGDPGATAQRQYDRHKLDGNRGHPPDAEQDGQTAASNGPAASGPAASGPAEEIDAGGRKAQGNGQSHGKKRSGEEAIAEAGRDASGNGLAEGVKPIVLEHAVESGNGRRDGDGGQETPRLGPRFESGRHHEKQHHQRRRVIEAVAIFPRVVAPEAEGRRGGEEGRDRVGCEKRERRDDGPPRRVLSHPRTETVPRRGDAGAARSVPREGPVQRPQCRHGPRERLEQRDLGQVHEDHEVRWGEDHRDQADGQQPRGLHGTEDPPLTDDQQAIGLCITQVDARSSPSAAHPWIEASCGRDTKPSLCSQRRIRLIDHRPNMATRALQLPPERFAFRMD